MRNNHPAVENAIENGYSFSIRASLTKAWEIVKDNFGLYVGYTLVFMFISFVLAIIPFVGSIASMVVSPALVLGWAIATRHHQNREPYEFNTFFKGFDKWVPLFVTSLLVLLIMLVLIIPFGIAIGLTAYAGYGSGMNSGTIMLLGVLGSILFIAALFVGASIMWAPYLVYFYDYEPMEAIKASYRIVKNNYIRHFSILLASMAIMLLGFLAFFVGLFIAIPVLYVAMYLIFSQITGTEENQEMDILDHFIPLKDE